VRHIISDNGRVYSEAEFALILRKAAELAHPGETPGRSSSGLTLADMKAAASEAGIDPALVERAARLLLVNSSSSSIFERLMGGPLHHGSEIHFPLKLDEARAARLLAAVQINAGQSGSGQSSSIGMVWHARDELEALSVTARSEEGGTSVAVHLDRRGTLAVTAGATLMGLAAATLGMFFVNEIGYAPALGAAAGIFGASGTLALARSYWTSSTKRVRERIGGVVDAIGAVVAQSESHSLAAGAGDDHSGASENET
jgi:hypothetical protein